MPESSACSLSKVSCSRHRRNKRFVIIVEGTEMNGQRKLLGPLAAALIAAAIAGPALGQGQGLSPTGPGTAAAARVSTVTATVTDIDLTTRQVTLRRPDGGTLLVIAGEQVRNLPQLRVGDTVTIEFYDTLTLELKKGGTGVPASRTDAYGESRAALGQRPGGITTRETVIVADVIAVDAPTQTISLRGPGGRTVILPLRDPEQFKRNRRGRSSGGDVRGSRRAFDNTGHDGNGRPPRRGAGGCSAPGCSMSIRTSVPRFRA
jgi:hypothetical protein